jgi:hypothetical protein
MEFWIGLSVGMHLGRVIADYLEKFIDAYELLPAETVKKITELQQAEDEVSSVIDAVAM